MKNNTDERKREWGFSLIEMLIVIALLTIITGAIFSQIRVTHQNVQTEQLKLDLFQQTREFTDQMTRDLRGAGYPNIRNFESGQLAKLGYSPEQRAPQTAVGLVKVSANEIWFETASQGDNKVWIIRYRLVNDGVGCPCLQRSQTEKVTGDPVDDQTGVDQNYVTEVQHVENGTSANPIFRAFTIEADGSTAEASLPITMKDPAVAKINSIEIRLTVRSPIADMTGSKPSVTMISTIRLANCSQAFGQSPDSIMGC